MKMTAEHYQALESAIKPIAEKYPVQGYLDQGLSEKRWRWDLLYNAGPVQVTGRAIYKPSHFVCDVLYQYLDDAHIDSALRKITGTK